MRTKRMTAANSALFPSHTVDYEKEFDEVRASYPNQIGREQALKYYVADRLELGEETAGRIQAAKRNYLAFLKRADQAWRQPQNLKTFFRNWRDWEPADTAPAARECSREDLIRDNQIGVAAFIMAHGDPDADLAARVMFESWSVSFVRGGESGGIDRWTRWKEACLEVGIDPKGEGRIELTDEEVPF